MNYLVILLFTIIVLLVLYLIYIYFFNSQTTMASLLYLKNQNPAILPTSIQTPNTIRYSYGVWIYVNTWPSTTGASLFNVTSGTDKLIDLKLNSSTLTLSTEIMDTDNNINNLTITNNFPAQKWTYVIISVDASVVDIYIDGKLVLSTILKKRNTTSPINTKVSNTPTITFGNPYDIYLSKFQRWTYATDPQTAWYNYYTGNGLAGSGNIYGAKISILQNNVSQQDFKLF